MARLQRKKTQGARKKKKLNGVDGTSSGIKDNVAAKKTSIFSGTAVRQKQPSTSPKALAVVKKKPGKIKGYLDKGLQFLREVKVELKKVVWPTRKQTIGSTVVVLILVMLISLYLGVVDFGLSGFVRLVLH